MRLSRQPTNNSPNPGVTALEFSDQIAIAIKAEASRKGATQSTCAGLYAIAIGLASSRSTDYWRPINEVLADRFGLAGRDRVKTTAWAIHDNAAAALKTTILQAA